VVLQIHHTALADRYGAVLALDPYHVPLVQAVQPGRAGDRAGLLPGDTVVAVAGVPVTRWGALVTQIRGSAGRPLLLEVGRPGGRVQISVVPDSVPEGNLTVGKVGVVFQAAIAFESRPYSFGEAVNVGFQATLASSTQIVRTVQGLLSARISSRELGGPILIGQMAAQSARIGFDAFLAFMALISVNLAVLNLLPIPILDGGQFFFLLAEGIARRPLSLAVRERLTQVGFFLLLLIMVLAFSNDIRRLLGW
jgi:regulator of sigma E protease